MSSNVSTSTILGLASAAGHPAVVQPYPAAGAAPPQPSAGRLPAPVPAPAPLRNPAAGSTNPAATLATLWAYLLPALDHMVRAPLSAPPSAPRSAPLHESHGAPSGTVPAPAAPAVRAPAIDADYHMRIHSAVYTYCTTQAQSAHRVVPAPAPGSGQGRGTAVGTDAKGKAPVPPTPVPPPAPGPPSGADLYERLDRYFADAARDVLPALGVPAGAGAGGETDAGAGAGADDVAMVRRLVPAFARFAAGARAVHRLLDYVNRHYVRRAIDEDRGWLRLSDLLAPASGGGGATAGQALVLGLEAGAGEHAANAREEIARRLRERRTAELARWGWTPGAPPAALARAEAQAEANSTPDRVVPLASLAHRRFRTEVVEPLLTVPKVKSSKGKKKRAAPGAGGGGGTGPKGRLARSVKALLEGPVEEEEKRRLAEGTAECLRAVGVRGDHPLRVRLEKFLAAAPVA